MFQASEIIVKSIGEDCKETAGTLADALDDLKKVSCTADASKKDDAYQAASDAIKAGYEDCPGHAKDLDALAEMLELSKDIKCGGG